MNSLLSQVNKFCLFFCLFVCLFVGVIVLFLAFWLGEDWKVDSILFLNLNFFFYFSIFFFSFFTTTLLLSKKSITSLSQLNISSRQPTINMSRKSHFNFVVHIEPLRVVVFLGGDFGDLVGEGRERGEREEEEGERERG